MTRGLTSACSCGGKSSNISISLSPHMNCMLRACVVWHFLSSDSSYSFENASVPSQPIDVLQPGSANASASAAFPLAQMAG